MGVSVVGGGVDERLDLAPDGIGGRWHELGHEDHADLLDRIDEEAGREHAAPVKIAGRARNARAGGVERDREAEAEADPGILVLRKNADAVLRQVAAADKMVRGHQIQRLAADDPHIAELAATELGLRTVAVYSFDNENIGEVSDVLLSKGGAEGAVDAVILDVGGFLGIGEKPVAVSFDSLEIMADENGTLYAFSKFTEDQLEGAVEYDQETFEVNRETMLVRPQG